MCAKGKCCFCMEVETGTLIFAILNMIFISLGLLISVVGVVVLNVMYQNAIEHGDQDMPIEVEAIDIGVNVGLAIIIFSFLVSFAFAIVLIVGICKNNPKHLKAYFVFGVTKIVFGLLTTCIVVSHTGIDNMPFVLLSLIPTVFYSLILVMIRMTYQKIEAETTYLKLCSPLVLPKY